MNKILLYIFLFLNLILSVKVMGSDSDERKAIKNYEAPYLPHDVLILIFSFYDGRPGDILSLSKSIYESIRNSYKNLFLLTEISSLEELNNLKNKNDLSRVKILPNWNGQNHFNKIILSRLKELKCKITHLSISGLKDEEMKWLDGGFDNVHHLELTGFCNKNFSNHRASGDEIKYLPKLKTLKIKYSNECYIEDIKNLNLGNITYLDVSNNLVMFDKTFIKKMRNLRVLILGKRSQGIDSAHFLSFLPNLECLELNDNKFKNINKFFSYCVSSYLKYIDLSNVNFKLDLDQESEFNKYFELCRNGVTIIWQENIKARSPVNKLLFYLKTKKLDIVRNILQDECFDYYNPLKKEDALSLLEFYSEIPSEKIKTKERNNIIKMCDIEELKEDIILKKFKL